MELIDYWIITTMLGIFLGTCILFKYKELQYRNGVFIHTVTWVRYIVLLITLITLLYLGDSAFKGLVGLTLAIYWVLLITPAYYADIKHTSLRILEWIIVISTISGVLM